MTVAHPKFAYEKGLHQLGTALMRGCNPMAAGAGQTPA